MLPLSAVRQICFALLSCLLVTAASARAQDARPRTLLGLVDETGVMTPIVRFDGTHWRNSWPDPDEKLSARPLPSSLRAVPRAWTGLALPVRWHAWPREAAATNRSSAHAGVPAAPRVVRVTRPVRYAAHCAPGLGLQSDLRGPAPLTDANSFPKRKIAIALSNDELRVDLPDDVRTDAPETRDLLRAASSYFRANVKTVGERSGLTLSPTGLRVQWDKVWSYALPGAEDERVYLLAGQARHSSGVRLAGEFWIRTRHGAPAEHRGRVVIDDDDSKMGSHRTPMGIVSIDARRFWLSTVAGYESEDYELIDLTSPRLPVVLTMPAGGC